MPLDAQLGRPLIATLIHGAGAVGVVGFLYGALPGGQLFAAEHTVDGNIRDFLFTFYADHGHTT